MFQRRLVLLAALSLVPTTLMGAQLVRLSVVEREEHLERVESKLVRRAWIPTTRGRLLDRHGRVLAVDRAAFELAVDYRVLDGTWAEREARRHARRAHAERWSNLTDAERDELTEPYRGAYAGRVESMWDRIAQISGVDRVRIDEDVRSIVARVERMHGHLASRRTERLARDRLDSGRTLDEVSLSEIRARASARILEQERAHVVVSDLSDDIGFAFLRLATESRPVVVGSGRGSSAEVPLMPGLSVENSDSRLYPFEAVAVDVDLSTLPGPLRRDGATSIVVEGVAETLVGGVRDQVHAEDLEARAAWMQTNADARGRAFEGGVDRGAYRDGDLVGSTGLEAAHEPRLRGLRGMRSRRVDTGVVNEIEPRAGDDITLTLDIALQARVRAAMSPELGLAMVQPWHGEPDPLMPFGTPIYGAAVVMDVETSEILALVSTPSVVRTAPGDEPEPGSAEAIDRARQEAIRSTAISRAIARPYQPGSIVKPLMVCAAERDGNYQLGQRIVCTGHYLEDRQDIYRCWIYKRYGVTHSPTGEGLTADEAIERSCNIFFYEIGRRLGSSNASRVYRELGVGEPLALEAGLESEGLLADPSDAGPADGILMAMGQGPVAWTPVHAAEAYATLARGGVRRQPTLVRSSEGSEQGRSLGYSPAAVARSMEGLRLAVTSSNGTGTFLPVGDRLEPMFNIDGVELWGKTGTAQTSDLTFDPDGDGPMERETLRRGEHAWFVVMAAREGETRPRYVVSVVMEYGGSGGRVSGPVVNQILHALRTEGYL